jgi:hypothetical protein
LNPDPGGSINMFNLRNTFALLFLLSISNVADAGPEELADEKGIRHYQFGVETLYPITQAVIWKSECSPVGDAQFTKALRLFRTAALIKVRPVEFDSGRVRIAIYLDANLIYVDQSGIVKLITSETVEYRQLNTSGVDGIFLRDTFGSCL